MSGGYFLIPPTSENDRSTDTGLVIALGSWLIEKRSHRGEPSFRDVRSEAGKSSWRASRDRYEFARG